MFEASDDHVDVTPWPFGGILTVEAYVKWDTLDSSPFPRIVDFQTGNGLDSFMLGSTAGGKIRRSTPFMGKTTRRHGEVPEGAQWGKPHAREGKASHTIPVRVGRR